MSRFVNILSRKSTLAISAVAAVAVVLLAWNQASGKTAPNKPTVAIAAATATTTTVAPTTTTSAPATTTTTVSRDGQYIGKEHTDLGSGLPVSATVMGSNSYVANTGINPKVGGTALYWVRDKQGDMLFVDTVVSFDTKSGVTTSKTNAVFDLPKIADTEYLCLATCVDKNNNGVDNVVGITGDTDATVKQAWTVDYSKLTFTPRATNDLWAYPQIPPPPDPARPALYGQVATDNNQDDLYWYTANEQVTSGGGWAGDNGVFINRIVDNKDNKFVIVFTQNGQAFAQLSFDQNTQVNIGGNATYNGQPVDVVEAINGSSDQVWVINESTHGFDSVPRANVVMS